MFFVVVYEDAPCRTVQALVKEFPCLVESLNLSRLVLNPTHHLGHILDLVISHGGFTRNKSDLSDHLPIVFGRICRSSTSNYSQNLRRLLYYAVCLKGPF